MAAEEPSDPNLPRVADSRDAATQQGPGRPALGFGISAADRLVAYLERLARAERGVRQLQVAYSERFPDIVQARRPDHLPERATDPERDQNR